MNSLGLAAGALFAAIRAWEKVANARSIWRQQTEDIPHLLSYLPRYAAKHDGIYPCCRSSLDITRNKVRGAVLYWQRPNSPPTFMHYIVGLTDSARGDTPVFASPYPFDYKRAVGFLSGYVKKLTEEEWQDLLKTTLETPNLSLRTTLKAP